MELFWVFLYNLSTPVSIACGLGIMFCIIMSILSFMIRTKFPFGSPENTDARNRIWTCAHLSIVLGLLFCIFYAIPSPTYDQKIIYRDRIKTVNIAPKPNIDLYNHTYFSCMNQIPPNATNAQICHIQTMQALNKTKVLTVTKTILQTPDRIFSKCLEDTKINTAHENERVVVQYVKDTPNRISAYRTMALNK
jgi:hypothetical protein